MQSEILCICSSTSTDSTACGLCRTVICISWTEIHMDCSGVSCIMIIHHQGICGGVVSWQYLAVLLLAVRWRQRASRLDWRRIPKFLTLCFHGWMLFIDCLKPEWPNMFSVLALVDYVYDFVCFQIIFFFPFPIMSINIEHSSSQNCSLGGGGGGVKNSFLKYSFL